MFSVIPPPPRYPTKAAYNGALAAGHAAPMTETNNSLSNPSGPEHQFLVGEGLHVLKDDIYLATPPPHPSESPIANPNPLATTPQPATAGTRLSLLRLDGRPLPPAFHRLMCSSSGRDSDIEEHPDESRILTDGGPDKDSDDGRVRSAEIPPVVSNAPAFGQGTAVLTQPGAKDAGKRRKPKNNMTKSNSSFISRAIVQETLSKRLQERPNDGLFAFANINRAFQWLDLSAPTKADYLTKILFTKAHCLCHDVNRTTQTNAHVDLIMGFSTGEIIWWEPVSQRYTRLNKKGIINGSPVSEIRWVPGSDNLFLAAHMDGSLIVYDKEKDDALFLVQDGTRTNSFRGAVGACRETMGDGLPEKSMHGGGVNHSRQIQVNKSVHSKNQKTNPVAVWKLSNQRINAFAFSPDHRHLAVVSEDGSLRIIDYLKEQLLDLFYSYYGGLMCVCWSPDGKYVLTGGQDDLLSIWSWCPAENAPQLMARCQGHHSWVTAVAFDPWRCYARGNYRFGSVGDDCRLCLWDFSVGMLHRPKGMAAAVAASVKHGGSLVSSSSRWNVATTETGGNRGSSGRLRSDSALSASPLQQPYGDVGQSGLLDNDEKVFPHPVEPRSRTAMLPPVLSKVVDKDPLCWLDFTADAIITSSKTGHIRTWNRPSDPARAT